MEPTDRPLVYSTWLKGLRYANEWFEKIDQDIYYRVYRDVIQTILERPSCRSYVACLKDAPDVILGYSVTEPGVVHWVFVKPDWRKNGIARDLFPKNTKVVTHLTRVGAVIKPKEIIFNPFI